MDTTSPNKVNHYSATTVILATLLGTACELNV
jgi:hypothetical protein